MKTTTRICLALLLALLAAPAWGQRAPATLNARFVAEIDAYVNEGLDPSLETLLRNTKRHLQRGTVQVVDIGSLRTATAEEVTADWNRRHPNLRVNVADTIGPFRGPDNRLYPFGPGAGAKALEDGRTIVLSGVAPSRQSLALLVHEVNHLRSRRPAVGSDDDLVFEARGILVQLMVTNGWSAYDMRTSVLRDNFLFNSGSGAHRIIRAVYDARGAGYRRLEALFTGGWNARWGNIDNR